MGKFLREIIDEADVLVPNGYLDADKLIWLNAINQEFFDVVKIPYSEQFLSSAGLLYYTLLGNIKEKDIDKVMVGHLKYRSLRYEDVQPGQNWFTFDNTLKVLTLSAAPSRSDITGILRFYQSPVKVFGSGNINTFTPDAPDEYHWIYVPGLAEYIAKANEEDEKAANYGGQYRAALQAAAQNFQKAGAT